MEDLHPFSQLSQLYVYEHPVAHGVVEALAVILMKRDHGCLIALPPGVIPDDELLAGMDVGMEGQVGPNTQVEAPRACFVGGSAEVQDGASLAVTLVDLGGDAVFRLFPLVAGEEPELLSLFDPLLQISSPTLSVCWRVRRHGRAAPWSMEIVWPSTRPKKGRSQP